MNVHGEAGVVAARLQRPALTPPPSLPACFEPAAKCCVRATQKRRVYHLQHAFIMLRY